MGDNLNLEVSVYKKELAIKLPLTTLGEAIEQREKMLGEREREMMALWLANREAICVFEGIGRRHFAGSCHGLPTSFISQLFWTLI